MATVTIIEIATTPPDWAKVAGDRTRYAVDVDGTEVIVHMTKASNSVSFEAGTTDLFIASTAIAYVAECEAFEAAR